MKKVLILGAGTAGTMMANQLNRQLNPSEWEITVLDRSEIHYYQPGFLFLPFDLYTPEQLQKPTGRFLPKQIRFIAQETDRIDPEKQQVYLQNGDILNYDILVVATGVDIAPAEVMGLEGDSWYQTIFDFYTIEGAKALRDKLATWQGGKLVVHIAEMPIKCPVAPLEFAFLADSFFKQKGIRDQVEITYVTPMDGAFTKPTAAKKLHYLLEEKNITIVPNFHVEAVYGDQGRMVDYGGKEVDFDLLVTVPTNMGSAMLERSGLGDDLNYLPTNKHTLQSKAWPTIFAIGDATDLPTSKAGSVAHFQADILTENILRFIEGQELKPAFDGHANCFVETGDRKAILIDFNYQQEPVTGTFPIPKVGPLKLLEETRANHLGKLAFRWIYWNVLLSGRPIPFVTSRMDTRGKDIPKSQEEPTLTA